VPFCFEAAFYYDYSTPFYRQTERLNILVASCKIESHWSKRTKAMTQERIDWNAVGKALGRVPIDCKRKWRSSQVPSNTPKSPRTAVCETVQEEESGSGSDSSSGSEGSSGEDSGGESDDEQHAVPSGELGSPRGLSSRNERWSAEEVK